MHNQNISEETKKALYKRAEGRCECTMSICSHHRAGYRCQHNLQSPFWDAHRKIAGGSYILSNLIAMCATCHKNTKTYGR